MAEECLVSRLIVKEVFGQNLADCDSTFSSVFHCLVLLSENNSFLWDTIYSPIFSETPFGETKWAVLNVTEVMI